MTVVLHLSDLHFGGEHFFAQREAPQGGPTIASAVSRCLAEANFDRIDTIVVSGDLFGNSQGADVRPAQEGLEQLANRLSVPTDRVLCVPGNHDADWSSETDKFWFYDKLIGDLSALGKASELPKVVETPARPGQKPLAFLLLNSALPERQTFAGVGEIGSQQVERLRAQLAAGSISHHTHILIAVLHHHLLPIHTRIAEYDAVSTDRAVFPSIVIDAVDVLGELAELGVSMVMHGHMHRPAVRRYQDILWHSHQLYIVAAGTAGQRLAQGEKRQFFVHDFRDTDVTVTSFLEHEGSPSRFRAASQRLRLTLSSSTQSDGYCVEHQTLSYKSVDDIQAGEGDYSDLNLLLLGVTNCPAAREAIRRLALAIEDQDFWTSTPAPHFELDGMYDLLGRWDLLVRFRASPGSLVQDVTEYFLNGLISEDLRDPDEQHPFGAARLLDVHSEHAAFTGWDTRGGTPNRTILGDWAAYDRRRCQRAFVYIDLPAAPKRDRLAILRSLSRHLDGIPSLARSVDSVCVGEDACVIEMFLRCGESQLVARLNREIEPILSAAKLQKYTLTAYGYEEDAASLPASSAAGGG